MNDENVDSESELRRVVISRNFSDLGLNFHGLLGSRFHVIFVVKMTVDRSGDRELELGPPTGTNVIQFHVIFLEFGYVVTTQIVGLTNFL